MDGASPTLFAGRARQGSSRAGPSATLLRRARERLRRLALLLGAISLVAIGLWLVDLNDTAALPIIGVVLVTTSLLYAVTRTRLSDQAVVDVGLATQVVLCAAISIPASYLNYSADGRFQDVTWTCIFIVLFPLLAPSSLAKIVAAGLASASTVPGGMLITGALLGFSPPANDVIRMSMTPLFCVVLAYGAAKMIHRLGAEAARAEEMGAYRLEKKLGEGGMGEVWVARHQLLARPAAIKLIRQQGKQASDLVRRRFEREAQVTASLRSPHTVELYDFGVSEDGTFYYVMELLDGMDLDQLVAEHGPLPPARVAFLLAQVCLSLEEAHDADLVHRDIKPANIFVCRARSQADFVKVLDFGLVGLVAGDEAAADLTEPNQIHGTPAYIAPEVAKGAEVDARADLYALGCVAYWLLTGQQVFLGSSPMQVVLAHVTEPPEPPSKHANEDASVFDELIVRCLAKDPNDRPSSARELREELLALPLADPWTEERAHQAWAQMTAPVARSPRLAPTPRSV